MHSSDWLLPHQLGLARCAPGGSICSIRHEPESDPGTTLCDPVMPGALHFSPCQFKQNLMLNCQPWTAPQRGGIFSSATGTTHLAEQDGSYSVG